MRLAPTAAILLSLAACGGGGEQADAPVNQAAEPPPPPVSNLAAPAGDEAAAPAQWDLQSSGEGVALALAPADGGTAIRLFCPAGRDRILVNVPGFRAVASEERLSLGSGGTVVALVADARGDVQRGGVSGSGPVPKELAAILKGGPAANYGAQTSGPHPAPPADLAKAFVVACEDGAAATAAATSLPKPPLDPGGPCMMQGDKALAVAPKRAIGTEPFWGAKIEGRCVTYSHPEDQAGTRVWTRYAKAGQVESWTGTLGGKPFVLRIRPEKTCSDGMSDRVYPLAADLVVNGETRKGCAFPD